MALVLMRRVAIIDLGSNTFNLLIVEQADSGHQIVFKSKIPAKLGAGGFSQNIITPAAFARGIDAIKTHYKTIQSYNVDDIYAFATSAARNAENGREFVEEIANQTDIEINIISGDREAELIYKGVSLALQIGNNPELIVDIGGGSTEFIIATNEGVLWQHSFDLGVSRLFEHLNPADPLSTTDIERFNAYLDGQLTILFDAIKEHEITNLIGSSGSFESLAKMIRSNSDETSSDHQGKLSGTIEYNFDLKELDLLNTTLLKSTFEEREKMKGLVSYRVETIPLASMFINYIIAKFSIGKVRLSTYALREGVISEI